MASQIVSDVSKSELKRHLNEIAQYVRLSGTPEEAKAFDHIERELKSWGYDVNRYESDALIGYPGKSSLEITSPDQQSIPCNGYSLSPLTSDEGVSGELVYVGSGKEADYAGLDVRGKIVISDGLAMPDKTLASQNAGAIAQIHINDDYIHEMCISPVWGTPIPETANLLPKLPAVSVTKVDGEKIRAAMADGPVTVRLMTQPYLAWCKIPTLTADLPGKTEDTFVMFSGHVDSWHYGAMDNGTANATQLEVARLIAERKDNLYRGIRMAFWSGHSHGRYASSAWYADTFWHDLHEHCAIHVNIDSVGAKTAVVLSEAPVMAETYAFARDVLKDTVDVDLDYRRMSRSSDQSFWGHGISSVLASLSEQGIEDSEMFKAMASLLGGGAKGGGLGWWWHTTEDTLDKIDDDNLVRDAGIYAETLWRLCTVDRMPLDMAALADEIADAIDGYIGAANGTLDLSETKELASNLATRIRSTDLTKASAARSNQLLMDLGRRLVPVNFTANGPFEQDLALGTQPVPGLREVAQLATLDPSSDDFRFLKTKLIRQRNRIEHALRASMRLVSEFNG
jgi:peptidase M28-like protein/PA domain-containing protein